MKKILTFIMGGILISSICFLIYSCVKKQDVSNPSLAEAPAISNVPDNLLESAKNWQARVTNVSSVQNVNVLSINTTSKRGRLQPNWKVANMQKLKDGRTVMVVESPAIKLSATSEAGVIRKYVYSIYNNRVLFGRIIEIYGDKDYIANHKDLLEHYNDNKPGDFTGVIIEYDVNYKYISSRVYNNGVRDKKASAVIRNSKQASGGKTTQALKTLDDCTDWYYVTYLNGIEIFETYLYTTCDGEDNNELGGDMNQYVNGAGDNSYADPGITSQLRICAGAILDDIKFQITNISQMSSPFNTGVQDEAGVSAILDRIVDNPAFGVDFSESTNYPGTGGHTDSLSYYPVKVELNTTYLNNGSPLAVAGTIIHEALHAYFQYGLNNYQNDPNFSNFQSANTALFPNGLNNGPVQHTEMVQDYVAAVGDMLTRYADDHNITSPDPTRSISDYCQDLAWGGLKDTPGYRALPPADQTRISNVLRNEQSGNTDSSGSPTCNP